MRRPRTVVLVTVVAALFAGEGRFALAQRAGAENYAASGLKRLEAERVDVLKHLLQATTTQYERGVVGFREVCVAHLNLTAARLDLAGTPEARSALFKDASQTTRELLRTAENRLQLGRARHLDALGAVAVCLSTQIMLAEQTGDAAEVSRRCARRIKVLQVAAEVVDEQFEHGTADINDLCNVHRGLTDARLASAKTTEARMAVLTEQLQVAKRMLKIAQSRTEVGATDSLGVSRIECLCLELDIQLAGKRNDPARVEQLRRERVETLKRVVAILGVKTRDGLADSFGLSAARVNLLNAQVELAETPAKRIALLEEQAALIKRLLDILAMQAGTGAGRPLDVPWTKALYLDSEIRIAESRRERSE